MAPGLKEIPPVWTTGWTDVLDTGTWRSAIPVHQRRTSPCQAACPAGGDIPVWLQQAKEGQYHQAWLTLVAKNPFPAMTGRICHHPCEGSCNRGEYDGAVTIKAVEQFLGDLALREQWPLPQLAGGKKSRAAVIGGGPAGLSCAYQLRMRGYGVTLFESQPELGGVLRYGIPRYRLPKEIVAGEIDRVAATGIEVRSGIAIGTGDLAGLEKEFDVICLATGAPQAKSLPQFPEDDARVLSGLKYLAAVSTDSVPPLGSQVVVIGGGSVAMDVARTIRRLGQEVKVLALEDMPSLPAQADEVQDALEEGVLILAGTTVRAAVDHDGLQLRLDCSKVILDPSAPAGELKPVAVPGTEFQVLCDTVILAVGQDPELAGFSGLIEVRRSLIQTGEGQSTSRPGIFACGDVSSSGRYVSAAIGGGERAARGMEAFLEGRPESGDSGEPVREPLSFSELNTFYFPSLARAERKPVPPEIRLQNFCESKQSLTEEEVLEQCSRCFSCGHCLKCDNCFYYCPDLAVVKDPSLAQGYRVQEQYCKGCGLCVEECPRGAVLLQEVKR